MLSDELTLEILALYDQGWEPLEITEITGVPVWCIRNVLDTDAEEFPEAPLRSNRVLH